MVASDTGFGMAYEPDRDQLRVNDTSSKYLLEVSPANGVPERVIPHAVGPRAPIAYDGARDRYWMVDGTLLSSVTPEGIARTEGIFALDARLRASCEFGGNPAHPARLIVEDGLLNLGVVVHDERPVPRNGLTDGGARQQQQLRSVLRRQAHAAALA